MEEKKEKKEKISAEKIVPEIKGKLSESEISYLKILHEHVYELEIEDMACYLKRPDKATLCAAESIGANELSRYNEILVENCWLGGCDVLREDAIYCTSVAISLSELLQVKKTALKKL